MVFFIILFLVLSLYSINADIIGIIGDIHCNLDAVDKTVKHMKAQGVSDIIITGDLINYKKECLDMSPSAIEKIHSKLLEVVPHEKMHVIPGNWEDPKSRGDGPTEGASKEELLKEMNRVFKERMVSQSCSTPTT